MVEGHRTGDASTTAPGQLAGVVVLVSGQPARTTTDPQAVVVVVVVKRARPNTMYRA